MKHGFLLIVAGLAGLLIGLEGSATAHSSHLLAVGSVPLPTCKGADPSIRPAESTWQQQIRDLRAREYEVGETPSGLQAPNREQGLRTWFRSDRIEVVPRSEVGRSWCFVWTTVAWGREGQLAPPGPARPVPAEGARVEYTHADGLVEWYVNRPEGLEQGFRIRSRPAGSGPLVLEGGVPRDLRAELAPDGASIEFCTRQHAPVLRYGGLCVRDAAGTQLPSSLALGDRVVRIVIDDVGARYPIEVDPILTDPTWTVAGDQTGEELGLRVATAGDVNGDHYSDVVISAPYYDTGYADAGRVFVYDAAGRLVVRLQDSVAEAGRHTLRWNGCDRNGTRVAAGTYFVRLRAMGVAVSRKVTMAT